MKWTQHAGFCPHGSLYKAAEHQQSFVDKDLAANFENTWWWAGMVEPNSRVNAPTTVTQPWREKRDEKKPGNKISSLFTSEVQVQALGWQRWREKGFTLGFFLPCRTVPVPSPTRKKFKSILTHVKKLAVSSDAQLNLMQRLLPAHRGSPQPLQRERTAQRHGEGRWEKQPSFPKITLPAPATLHFRYFY